MSQLLGDWSIHAARNTWPTSRGRLFLPHAFDLFGNKMHIDWTEGEGRWAAGSRLTYFPPAINAFKGKLPVTKMHDLYAAAVRAVISPGDYEADRLEEKGGASLAEAHIPDPTGGAAILEPRHRAKTGADLNDAVTRSHWTHAHWEAAVANDYRDGIEERAPGVVRHMLSLLQSGALTTWSRLVGGGFPKPVDPLFWEIDNAFPRFGCGGFNARRPIDAASVITHYLFVSEDEAIQQVEMSPELETPSMQQYQLDLAAYPDIPGVVLRSPIIEQCAKDLCVLFQNKHPKRGRDPVVKEDFFEVEKEIWGVPLTSRAFDAAWDQAITLTGQEYRRSGGRRIGSKDVH